MQYNFSATGYAGGFLALSLDTEAELETAATVALAASGLIVRNINVVADEWDIAARIFHNQFHYRLTVIVDTDHALNVAFPEFKSALENLTGFAVVASNLTAGGPVQAAPNSNPLPSLQAALTPTLVLVTIAIIGLVVILGETK
jgi:hypothetical protein